MALICFYYYRYHYIEVFPFLRPLTDPVYARIIAFPLKIEIEQLCFQRKNFFFLNWPDPASRMTGSYKKTAA